MELHYILTKEDISAYYEALLENDDSTFAFRWRLRLFLPLGIVVFLIFFSQAAYWWLVGAGLSAVWILIATASFIRSMQGALCARWQLLIRRK